MDGIIPKETLDAFGGDELRARVFYEKYALRDLEGNQIEKTPEEMWRRVAREIASVESKDKREEWEEKFYWLMEDFKFIPGGRILFGAGNPRRATLLNCYVLPIKEDSIEGIFETAKEMARTYSFGGGVGVDISILRPKGAVVNNAAIFSTGSVSFMEIFSQTTGTIGQAGRRGALMITIHCAHPDVEEFIVIKNDPERRRVRYANISVLVSDEFMKAVEKGDEWELWYPDKYPETSFISEAFKGDRNAYNELINALDTLGKKYAEGTLNLHEALLEVQSLQEKFPNIGIIFNGSKSPYYMDKDYFIFAGPSGIEPRKKKVYKRVKAEDLWNRLIQNAWSSAEPGVIFISRMREYSTTEYNGMEVLTVNPCSEISLQPYGCCCLGNVNLSYFVKNAFEENAGVDYDNLEKALRYAVRFLDNVLTYNEEKHPLKEQSDSARWTRRIGVGFTGLGDMLAKLRIRYDSEDAVKFVDKLFYWIKHVVYDESVNLAEEKGRFPAFEADKHLSQPFFQDFKEELKERIKRSGLRNASLLTVPPVGSGSILAGTSSGIEPIFALYYIRRSESLSEGTFRVYHWLVKEYMEKLGLNDDSFDREKPEFFVTAHEIDPYFRVRMQATIQKHIDHSISSTVNLPEETSPKTIGDIYFNAWRLGCKGITVYREGSREGVLITEEKKEKKTYLIILENGTKIEAEEDDIVIYNGKEYTAKELYESMNMVEEIKRKEEV